MIAKILQTLHKMKAQMHKALSFVKTMPCFVFFVGIRSANEQKKAFGKTDFIETSDKCAG